MARTNKVTAKQKTFARLIVSGMTQVQAYQQAFNTHTLSENSLAVTASNEARKPHVKEYIEKMEYEQVKYNAMIANRDEQYIKTLILDQFDRAIYEKNDTAIAKYAEILNKMNGTYINITKDITEKESVLDGLSTDEIKSLLDSPEKP